MKKAFYFISLIRFLNKVHNSVNKRLANDESTDPIHPKIQFPSQQQCPKCYLADVDVKNLKEHESPWVINEVLLFLSSFYSKYQIEGVRELDQRDSNRTVNLNESTSKFYDYEVEKKQVDSSANNSKLKRQAKRLNGLEGFAELDLDESNQLSNTASSILRSNLIIFCFISLGLACVYFYFNMRKRKFKLKKHLI